LIERRLGVAADSRGNHVTIEGPREAVEQARRVLESLYDQIKRGHDLVPGDVEGAVRHALAQHSLFDFDPGSARPGFEEINLRKRPVRARTAGQDAYIRALKRHALVFGTGPAGTGKTWLAVAHAVQLFERKEVDRIILSRPAVEAASGSASCPATCARRSIPICADLRRALRSHGRAHRRARAADRRDRDRAARLHARAHAVECGRDPRRGAEHHVDADEDVPDAARREQPDDRHRRSEPGRPAAGPDSGLRKRHGFCGSRGHRSRRYSAEDVIRHELVARIVDAYDKAALKAKRETRDQGMSSLLASLPARAEAAMTLVMRSKRARATTPPRVRPTIEIVTQSPLWKEQRNVKTLLRRAITEAAAWCRQPGASSPSC
jgi:phosphate starvation-inducible PhoH-like protein